MLSDGATVAGRVTDRGGAPLAGARVALSTVERWPSDRAEGMTTTKTGDATIRTDSQSGDTVSVRLLAETETDDAGAYRFTGLPATRVRVVARAPEGRDFTSAERELDVGRDEVVLAIDLELAEGLVLTGRVSDESGAPVPEAVVAAAPPGEDFDDYGWHGADQDGRFEVRGLPPGRIMVLAFADGFLSTFEEHDAGVGPLALVLQRAPKLRGVVVDARSGEPITRYRLAIDCGSGTNSVESSFPEGRFAQDGVPGEPCDLTVEADGYEPMTKTAVVGDVPADAPLRFELRPRTP